MGILGNFSSVLGTTTHCTGPTVVKVVQHRFIVSLSLSLSLSLSQSSLLLLSDIHYLQSKPTTQTLSRSPFSHFLLFHFMSLVAKTVFARYSQSLAIQQRAALAVTDINKREREREERL